MIRYFLLDTDIWKGGAKRLFVNNLSQKPAQYHRQVNLIIKV